ncbi:MAG TPA: hypothetical protein VF844_20560, partial [Ktedonobacteraceae bacterium]
FSMRQRPGASMSLQQSPTSTIERPVVRNKSETRLHGRGLLIARAGWVLLTLLVLALNAIAIPRADALLQAVCQPGTLCINGWTPAEVSQLQQSGLSPGFLAAYQIWWDVGSTLIYTALATLIFWRRSADRMALFCAYMLVLFGGATYTSLLDIGLRTVTPTLYWLVGGLELLGQVCVPTFFLLFPSGRFVPRWTRWGVLVFALYEVWNVFFTDQNFDQGSPLNGLSFAVLILGLVGLQVYRYRRISTFRERQQTKWVVFGLAVALGGFALFLIFTIVNHFLLPDLLNSPLAWTLIPITVTDVLLLFIPISIAIAILRSRLYDIDTIINKALVYGLLTGILGVLYAGLIIGLESLVGLISGQNTQPPVIVVSTLTIYALFQPLRAHIQRIIDRRFYRRKYDAARTLEAFSTTLRHEVDLATLSKHLVAVVQETMQPAHLSLWLRSPEHQRTHWSPGRANPAVPSEGETRNTR